MELNLDKFIITEDGKYIGWKQSEFEQALEEWYRERIKPNDISDDFLCGSQSYCKNCELGKTKDDIPQYDMPKDCPCGCHKPPFRRGDEAEWLR